MKEQIKNLIEEALKTLNIEYDGQIVVEEADTKEHGDYSSNIAMQLARVLKESPMTIAEKIVDKIVTEQIKNIEIVTPGFINFFMKKEQLLSHLNKILELGNAYGRSNIGNNTKINVEFVSANPTGLIHVGTSRCAAYGDSLCRILSFAGFSPTREYYFNDGGAQIVNLGKSLYARYQEALGLEFSIPEDGYHGNEIKDIALELIQKFGNTKLEEDPIFFEKYATDYLISIIKEDLADFRVTFDVWTSEQDVRKSGKVEECLKILENQGDTFAEDNATWFKSTKYGDDKDRVLIKNDGNYTYLVPDIAYHLDKINRGYKEIVDILGADHHGYVRRLKASVEALGYDKDKIRIKIVQMVRLLRDGEEVKMSKRTGLTVTMRELMDEVGVNAARYFFATRSLDSQMDFDIDLAKKNSNENPFYYVSYAYARINTILEKVESLKPVSDYKYLNEDAGNILDTLYRFPEVVENAALKELPHLIANYAYDLANSFHNFYSNNRIIVENEIQTAENINLIKAVKITLKNALDLIGVVPMEKM